MYEMAGRHNLRRQFCVTEPGSGEREREKESHVVATRFRQQQIGILANAAISATVLAAAIASLPSHPIPSHHPKLQETTSQKSPPPLYTDHGYCWPLLVYLRTALCHWQMYAARMLLEHSRVSLPALLIGSNAGSKAWADGSLHSTHTGKERCNGIPLNRLFVTHADRGGLERSFQRNPSM